MIMELLERNTRLTETTREMSAQIKALTERIHNRLDGERPSTPNVSA
jgi:hypothetical protein